MTFLEARLAEDERHALSARVESWSVEDFTPSQPDALPGSAWVVTGPDGADGVAVVNGSYRADHIARHDPVRVLREVAAKREILAEFDGAAGWADELRAAGEADGLYAHRAGTLLEVIRILARAYSDHPEYLAEGTKITDE